MSTRNLIWLVVIVAVGLVVGFTAGWLLGLIAAGVTLAVSEVVERRARAQRAS